MSPKSVAVLTRAVRGRVVLKYFGQLSLSLVGMTALPLAAALWWGESALAARCALALAALLAIGLPLARLTAPSDVQVNEALAITSLTFAAAALIMGLAFHAVVPGLTDALFEATSALTTTGLSALPGSTGLPPAFLLTRAWLQWYGGLAIVVLALVFVLPPGAAAKRLAGGEAEAHDMVAGTRIRARRVLAVYATLTALGFAALWLLGVPPFDAAVHTLAGVSTGGFSSYDESIAGLDRWHLRATVMLIALCGAISFSLYYRAWGSGWRALATDPEVVALVCLAGLVSALLAATMALAGGQPWSRIVADAPLLGLSAQTTVGFTPRAVAGLDPASKIVLILGMVVGGDAGSTAGGIKIIRFLIVLRLMQILIARTCLPPHAVMPVRAAGRRLEAEELQIALGIVLLYATVIVASWIPFVAAGHEPLDALFDVVSALGTVGLSTGVAGPALEPWLKWVLCADMLMGRLEIVAVLVLFYPRTWIGRRAT